MTAGCPICGSGADWSRWPDWTWVRTDIYRTCYVVGWMQYEYLCPPCVVWADRMGARWDGVVNFKFTDFKSSEPTLVDRMRYAASVLNNHPLGRRHLLTDIHAS